jgi:hypothetical protein
MVIVATLTALGFYLAQRKVTADAERNLQQTFRTELSSMHKVEELRHAALADRCNALVASRGFTPRSRMTQSICCIRARRMSCAISWKARNRRPSRQHDLYTQILSLSRRHRRSHQAAQSLGCRRTRRSDRSSTFADKIARHTTDRVYPICWRYPRSDSRADLLDRHRGSGFGARDRVQATRARKQKHRNAKWHLG